jgi:hypothetical protein
MASDHLTVLVAFSLLGCKREAAPESHAPVTAPVPAASLDAGVADRGPTWYRAVIRATDGVEVLFFLGVPEPSASGQAVFKVGSHEVRSEATFDGKILKIPHAVHQTAVDGAVGPDGILRGSFSTSWRAWGASSIQLTATKVEAPTSGTLATVASDAAVLDLGALRTVWRLTMQESGVAKLVVHQIAPGDFAGLLLLDTGNIIYVAGNGRGDAVVLSGFDGTAGYRVELALGADRTQARGKYFGGHRLDWREALTAGARPAGMSRRSWWNSTASTRGAA